MKQIQNLVKKYHTFIKYVFSAGISFLIDLTFFTIFVSILKVLIASYSIIISTILARGISSFINYHINRNTVFKKYDDNSKIDKESFIKNITLVIIQMFISSISVFVLYNLTKQNETLIKIPVECILFIINYFVQKLFIFNKSNDLKKLD